MPGNGVDPDPWYFKPVLGPLSASDITAIVGASLAPMHVGYYKPFLPLGLAGQALLSKEEQYRQQALEQQQREPLAQAIGPLWQARYGTAAPPEVTQAVRESPAGAEFVEPFLKPVTPAKGSYTAAEQAAWGAEVEALPEGTIPPEFKQALKTMGPIQGKSALRAMAPNYIPATAAVQEQRLQTRVEPVQVRITGQKELAGIEHGYKSQEIMQETQAEQEKFERELAGVGFEQKAKKDADLIAADDAKTIELDQSINATQRLRALAADVSTGKITGNAIAVAVRQALGDTDIGLFEQYLKQAALPAIKPLLGSAQISNTDVRVVLDMFAGTTIPSAANVKSLDAVLQGLTATKRAMAARRQYFDSVGSLKGFGTEAQVSKGPKVRYIGDPGGGFKVYEDFATGERYARSPEGTWGRWKLENP